MFGTVAVPVWLLVLILGFAAISFATHFLFPSVRWFFRRRAEKALARLNARLDRKIDLFKLAQRADMVARLAYDQRVVEAAMTHATETGVPGEVAFEEARRYAREIVPGFSATVYFGFGTRAAKWISRLLFRVRVGKVDQALREIDPKATVIFVMNHRSNLDYVLVTWLVAGRSAVSYAVGEWARVWPLSALIRSMGAYFIRRKSERPLYRRILSRYVQMATAEGVTQAIFPEGGLSLDGRTAPARLGILSYIVQGERPDGRDVVFVPVALNYDRIVEDRVLVEAHRAGVRRFRAPILSILAFIWRHIWRALFGRFRGFGNAVVRFGTPISLASFSAGRDGDVTEELADRLMGEITRTIPVLPVPLVSAAWGAESETDRAGLLARSEGLAARLAGAGAELALPEGVAGAVDMTLAIFRLRKFVTENGGKVQLDEERRDVVDFYAASALQLLDAGAETKRRKTRRVTPNPRP